MSCPHTADGVTHDAATCPAVRPEIMRPLPPRMQKLSVDPRGYPVPWFVSILADGTPEFRAMDTAKWAQAIRNRLCWLCGEPLGRFATFVAGPMCGINRTSSEPPCHLDCARWSAANCPFLSRPHASRREMSDATKAEHGFVGEPAGFALTRNPGVTLLWTTTSFKPFRADNNGGPLIQMGDPTSVEFYCEGRDATRDEIEASIAGGLPALEALARDDRDPLMALDALWRAAARFRALLPAA